MKQKLEEMLKEAEIIPGLKEHLSEVLKFPIESGMGGLVELTDLKINPEKKAAVYLLNINAWEIEYTLGGPIAGPIEYSVNFGGFLSGAGSGTSILNGRVIYCSAHCDPRNNPDWGKHYDKIESFEVQDNKIYATIASASEKRRIILSDCVEYRQMML